MLKRWLRRRTSLWVFCFLAGIFAGCGQSSQQDAAPVTPYDKLREQVVDRVKKRLITPDASGVATLPNDLKDAAPDARVITANDPALGLRVAFNLSVNPSGRSEYLLYSEKEIPERTSTVSVGALQLNISRKSKTHWYQAVHSGR